MQDQKPQRSAVRRGLLRGKDAAKALVVANNVCQTGNQCQEVQASPAMSTALGLLRQAVAAGQHMHEAKLQAATALRTATANLKKGMADIGNKLALYEAAVSDAANCDGSLINAAGLVSRDMKAPPAALEAVSVVHALPGKQKTQAVIFWPAAKGASAYAIEVNFTPADPNGTWTPLRTGTSRRRVVTAPEPGAQFLVRVAAQRSDGTQSDWTTPILATAA